MEEYCLFLWDLNLGLGLSLFLQKIAKEVRRLERGEAGKFSRTRCMDLISLESQWEQLLLASKMKELISDTMTTGSLRVMAPT